MATTKTTTAIATATAVAICYTILAILLLFCMVAPSEMTRSFDDVPDSVFGNLHPEQGLTPERKAPLDRMTVTAQFRSFDAFRSGRSDDGEWPSNSACNGIIRAIW